MKTIFRNIILLFITLILANCAANSATTMKKIATSLDVKQKLKF